MKFLVFIALSMLVAVTFVEEAETSPVAVADADESGSVESVVNFPDFSSPDIDDSRLHQAMLFLD